MRSIFQKVLSIFWSSSDEKEPLQVVSDYRDSYQRIDEVLNSMPEVLKLVHTDFNRLSQNQESGRESDFTSENIFRAILVMHCEGLTFRETTLRIAESETLQKFCRLWKKSSLDHTLLCRMFHTIQPETWNTINQLLGIHTKHRGTINVDDIRTDTTVTESNIHYPTDSSLLWDTYRILERYVKQLRQLEVSFPSVRFHLNKVKKLYLEITRFSRSKNKRRRRWIKKQRKQLINRVRQMLLKVEKVILPLLKSSEHPVIQRIATTLKNYFPTMDQIIRVAQRRLNGENVPVTEKVFSLFEPHTELIIRGRRNKPVEFGHKILISETPEKFITDYVVFEKSPSDNSLLSVVIERHEDIFGQKMKTLSADMGFRPNKEEWEDLEEELEYIAVPKRLSALGDALLAEYQRFRAGIEGTISCLKRAYRLSRCCFRGFQGFCQAVGSAIFCHNLVVITAKPKKIKPK
jgi:IS5 family transposase